MCISSISMRNSAVLAFRGGLSGPARWLQILVRFPPEELKPVRAYEGFDSI